MRYYIIAGEASGDLHGSNLIREIRKLDDSAEIRAWGGDLMQEAGATLVKHYRELAFMGFAEVVSNLRTIFRNLDLCKKDIAEFKPDVLVLIDYPGFNLRIAEWAHQQPFRIVFYISPQVWAWKENRVKKMKKNIDRMLVILPFEKDYYRDKWNWDVDYVGHPLVEVIDRFKAEGPPVRWEASSRKPSPGQRIIALLPGSRKQEILKKLPVMLDVARYFPDDFFVVAKAPGLDDDFYTPMLEKFPNVASVKNQTYALLRLSSAALVTSGTATLETALFGVPEIVCYKGNPISYLIARQVIRVKYISLVNLIMDRLVVKELIQHELTADNLKKELDNLLNNPVRREELFRDYAELNQKLAGQGNASANAAKIVVVHGGLATDYTN